MEKLIYEMNELEKINSDLFSQKPAGYIEQINKNNARIQEINEELVKLKRENKKNNQLNLM